MGNEVKDTDIGYIKDVFSKQKNHAPSLRQTSAKDRLEKINRIYNYLLDSKNKKALLSALYTDLGKPSVEAKTSEIGVLLHSIKDIKHKLKGWMRDQRVPTPLLFTGNTSHIIHEPKGVALIISPWNYPFQLCINPLLYALAAGCTSILKPSEYSKSTSGFIARMITELFDEKEVAVCQGGIPTSQALLDLPFDHMYFTGSPVVGKIVMTAAAQHLSSVTLELGGKSPCFVDDSVNIDKVAKKIVWGKFFNTGQTCIAPDYILVSEKNKNKLAEALKKHIQAMYNPNGKGIEKSKDLGRLINDKHFQKVSRLISEAVNSGAKLITGGITEPSERFIAPTILTDIKPDADILQKEIFGPVLPILTYQTLDEALAYVNNKPKPLALYIMSKKSKNIQKILGSTSAGGTVINDFLTHFANHNLPFGGVNNSGIGKSHGKHGYLAFTNQRSLMKNKWSPTAIFHPPYTDLKEKLADLAGKLF